MSRDAEVIVLARGAEAVMEPLTRPDESRQWHQCFRRVDDHMFGGWTGSSEECYAWVVQFGRSNAWTGLLAHLESLPWPNPGSVQVLVHDQDDDCFGLWMIHDGRLVEVSLPRTRRVPFSSFELGVLERTDRPGR
ncbi:hypothetical protein ABZY44_35300 [Streptomyces sp. NPDC006544]|uniref:hypothetical protein n=1 Tax=Streptomyces sp. NPDC006544 TaxID=3154583 RepID=UPI0033A5B786